MFGHDLHQSFVNPRERRLGPRTVGRLGERWRFQAAEAVTAPPSIVDQHVYVGDWAGWVYKLRAKDGALVWKMQTDVDPMVDTGRFSDGGHITGAITVADVRQPRALGGRQRWLFVGSGKTLYAIDDADGRVVWKRIVPGNPDAPEDPFDPVRILTSITLFEGHLFFGTVVDGSDGYRGRFLKARAATGEIVASFETDQGGGGLLLNRGCGSVWAPAAIQERLHQLYTATSDCGDGPLNPGTPAGDPQPPYSECVLSLRTDDLSLAWAFCPREYDLCDFDFGSASVLFEGREGPRVAHGGKDGFMRVFDAASGAIVWERQVVAGGSAGGFIAPVAGDGRRIVGGTAIGNLWRSCPLGGSQPPHVHAFDARTGEVLWQVAYAPTFSGASIANGVVLLPQFGARLRAYDLASGEVLFESDPLPGAFLDSAPAIAGGMAFFGSGQGDHEGWLFGFGVP
jgi:polyvinyl alcohol dehydrogenase (cytochrome)